MAKIALLWELGGHLGHVVRFASVARELIQRGHCPTMVLRDTSRANEALGDLPVTYLQAPVWQGKVEGLPLATNYTETLLHRGFLDPDKLRSLVDAWRCTYAMLEADVLVFDHAPVAQLAAHTLSTPTVRLGSSFAVTPDISPFPPYVFWQQNGSDHGRLLGSEARCMNVVNDVLQQLGSPESHSLKDLFQTDATFLSTQPEFDVYGQRNNASYVGALVDHQLGALPKWPTGSGPKIFAYLKPKFPHLDFVLTVLSRLDARVISYIPGLATTISRNFESASLSFSPTPLSLAEVSKEADYAICHAGAGTIDVFASAGVPQFLIPTQMEQMMNATRAAEAGVAMFYPQNAQPQVLQKLFKQFFSNTTLRENAKQWPISRPVPPLTERISTVCDGIENLL